MELNGMFEMKILIWVQKASSFLQLWSLEDLDKSEIKDTQPKEKHLVF